MTRVEVPRAYTTLEMIRSSWEKLMRRPTPEATRYLTARRMATIPKPTRKYS
ncbi:hypothetical protein KAV47_01595 [Candidatus Bathyarchaeota archaeon]|nr:hypothetical protein [Candidatus Bathyarchaeota archaeon]